MGAGLPRLLSGWHNLVSGGGSSSGGGGGAGGTIASVTATGADQAGAAAIPASTLFIRVVGGASATGLRLPAATAGSWLFVEEESLNAGGEGDAVRHLIYPAVGEAIRPLAVNLPTGLHRYMTLYFYCVVAGTWEVSPLPRRNDSGYYYYTGPVAFGNTTAMLSGLNLYGILQSFDGRIVLGGGTGLNAIYVPDNLVEGFHISENANRYINVRTTNGTERIEVKRPLVMDGAQAAFTGAAALTTAGTTITVDWVNGNFQIIDLQGASGNVTLTLSNPYGPDPGVGRASYFLKIIQGSVTRNIIWPAAVKWPGGVAPTISAANDAVDGVWLMWDAASSTYMATFQQAFA